VVVDDMRLKNRRDARSNREPAAGDADPDAASGYDLNDDIPF